jgi:hypothetical protein
MSLAFSGAGCRMHADQHHRVDTAGVNDAWNRAPAVAAIDAGPAVDHLRQQVAAAALKILDRYPLDAGIHIAGSGRAGPGPGSGQKGRSPVTVAAAAAFDVGQNQDVVVGGRLRIKHGHSLSSSKARLSKIGLTHKDGRTPVVSSTVNTDSFISNAAFASSPGHLRIEYM